MTEPLKVASRYSASSGAVALRQRGPLPRPGKPTAAQVDVERAMWGPHPNPTQAWIERQIYDLGHAFLRGLLSAVMGKRPAEFAKAEPPKPPGWGEVMKLFQSPAAPAEKLASWTTLVDGFAEALLPATTVENAIASWALRSALMHQIGERVKAVTVPGAWDAYWHTMPPAQARMVEWSKLRGGQFVTKMSKAARQAVLDALVESEMSGGNAHDLERVLFERLGTLNRDWRRIALTETGMAVSNGQLTTVLASGGDWEGIWVAGPGACPFCLGQQGKVYRVVSADFPGKDGRTMIWPGKTNVGRSMHLHRRDGSKRGPEELWEPCQPAHPLCACTWTFRRVLKSSAAKKADALLSKLRADRFKAGVS